MYKILSLLFISMIVNANVNAQARLGDGGPLPLRGYFEGLVQEMTVHPNGEIENRECNANFYIDINKSTIKMSKYSLCGISSSEDSFTIKNGKIFTDISYGAIEERGSILDKGIEVVLFNSPNDWVLKLKVEYDKTNNDVLMIDHEEENVTDGKKTKSFIKGFLKRSN